MSVNADNFNEKMQEWAEANGLGDAPMSEKAQAYADYLNSKEN